MDVRTPNRLPFHRLAVFPVLLVQLLVLLLLALVLWQWQGSVAGYSGFVWWPDCLAAESVLCPQGVPF